jgi:hypothetical protein
MLCRNEGTSGSLCDPDQEISYFHNMDNVIVPWLDQPPSAEVLQFIQTIPDILLLW